MNAPVIRSTRFSATMLVAMLLAACAMRPITPEVVPAGDVGYKVIPPLSEGAQQRASGQSASGGSAIDQTIVLPIYPDLWLPKRLPPVLVEALVVVDEAGRAGRVEVSAQATNLPCDACAADFAASVHDAVMQWTFAPLQIVDWIDGPDSDGDGEPDTVMRGVVATKPYSLRLQFIFSVRDGEGVVTRTPQAD